MIIPVALAATLLALQPATQPPAEAPKTPPAAATPETKPAQRAAPSDRPVSVTTEGDLFESKEGTIVATGLRFAEGPVWQADGTLLICDLQGNAVYTLNPADGRSERKPGEGVDTLRKPSGNAAGAALDAEGRLVFAQFDGTVVRRDKAGVETILPTEVNGKKVNTPNDIVVKSDGSIYFTDFGAGKDDHADHAGVYRIAADGTVKLLTKDVVAPNGLAFSGDEKVLYVALYRDAKVMAYDVTDEGDLSNGRVFAEIKDTEIKGRSTPDGVKVDAKGNVWTTGAGGIWVLSPEGKRIGRILVPMASNLCFGGADGKTVFVTAGPRVVAAKLKEPAIKVAAPAADATKPAAK
jgi:gluconolactonase